MSKKPLLSICIPTYNREAYLQRLIESIVSQKEFTDTEDVEIMIDDGPSKDNTAQLVKTYQEKYPGKIRYFHNDVAIGMCPAFLEAIEFSGWEYTWLFGSDDVMSKEALKVTLDMIKREKPWIILSDRYVFSDISETNIELATQKDDIVLNWPDAFIYHLWVDNKKNGRMNGNFFTFISIFCFKQELYVANKAKFLEKYSKTYTRLNKNYFNFALIPFFDLHWEKIVIIKSKILVFCQGWNHGWTFSSMDISKDLYFLVSILRKNYKITPKCNLFFNHMLLGWFVASVSGVFKKHSILKLVHKPLSYIIKRFI